MDVHLTIRVTIRDIHDLTIRSIYPSKIGSNKSIDGHSGKIPPWKSPSVNGLVFLGKILTGNHRFSHEDYGLFPLTQISQNGGSWISKNGGSFILYIHKIKPKKKTPPFLDIHRSPIPLYNPMIFPLYTYSIIYYPNHYKWPIKWWVLIPPPWKTSRNPPSRHLHLPEDVSAPCAIPWPFSQALTTAPQVTSVDYGSAWWPSAGKPWQKWGFNHWKYGKRWISPFEMWI